MARNDLLVTRDTFRRFKCFYNKVQIQPLLRQRHYCCPQVTL